MIVPPNPPPETPKPPKPHLFWLIYEDCLVLPGGLTLEITLEHPRPQCQDAPDPVLQ